MSAPPLIERTPQPLLPHRGHEQPEDPEPVRRPGMIWALLGVLTLLGVTALAGGTVMVFQGAGSDWLPTSLLADVPLIESWLVPGLVLSLGFGVGSLVTAYGVWRRPAWRWLMPLERATGYHWSAGAAVVIGAGHVIWILLELIYLPELSWLQPVYGTVGVALVLLPQELSARSYLSSPVPATEPLEPQPGEREAEEPAALRP